MTTARIYKEDFENPNIWKLLLIDLQLPPDTDELTVKAVAYMSKSKRQESHKTPEQNNFGQGIKKAKQMDIKTAKSIYSMLNSKAYLNEQEQSLFDEAEVILDDANLIDENGNIVVEE